MSASTLNWINSLDRDELRAKIRRAQPFPHFCVDDFLEPQFAEEIYRSFPSFAEAQAVGRQFATVNEKKKIQITDSSRFAPPIARLNELLASREFLDLMSYVFDIPDLIEDADLMGGGIHETDTGGRLDVHIDFNFVKAKEWHRRLNILIYFNKDWKEEYGGYLDIWDKEVKRCHGSFAPIFNRACGFATSDISFHGVTPLTCPPGVVRRSFATYYYTREAPPGWTGEVHSTIFKARPEEWMRSRVLMPAEVSMGQAKRGFRSVKQKIKSLIGK
jgi:Rps23 Pro-64 3,4-dihydroxylase Tpa1-like proline 4-hydroxylase